VKLKVVGFLSFLLFTMSFTVFAAETHRYFVHLKAENAEIRTQIANIIPIESVVEDSVYAFITKRDFLKVKQLFKNRIVEYHSIALPQIENRLRNIEEFPSGDEKFHTYQETIDELHKLNKENPSITKLISMGKSVEGRDILGIEISSSKRKTRNSILIMGTHHAREHLTTELTLMTAQYILGNSGKSERIRNLYDDTTIYIFPLINPDGATYDITGGSYHSWRKNRRNNGNGSYGVDLNRNYGHRWGTIGASSDPRSDTYMGTAAFSEPETRAVKEFVEQTGNISTILTMHTYSELILYPWGYTYDGVGGADQQVYETMANQMSKWNGYKAQQSSDLYRTAGDTCDWAYAEHNIFCFTFELSPKSFWDGGFYPGASAIVPTFNANIRPIVYAIENTNDPYAVLNQKLQAYNF